MSSGSCRFLLLWRRLEIFLGGSFAWVRRRLVTQGGEREKQGNQRRKQREWEGFQGEFSITEGVESCD